MADIKVLQSGDLDTKSFENDNTNGRGGIKIRLNPSKNNMLSLTSTGLYYSYVADHVNANLYVDAVNGNDNNAGTRASPIKTVKEAFRRIKIGQASSIFLKANQTHIARSSETDNYKDKTFSFYAYGETLDAIKAARKPEYNNWAYFLTNIKEVQDNMPTLRLICDREYQYGGEAKLYPFFFANSQNNFGSRDIIFEQIIIDISNVRNGSSLTPSVNDYGITSHTNRFTDTITCVGCIFKLPRNDANAFHLFKINSSANTNTYFISCYYDSNYDVQNAKYLLHRVTGSIAGISVLGCGRSGYVNNPGERFNAPYNNVTNTSKTLIQISNAYSSIQQDGDVVKSGTVLLYP